MIRLLTAFTYEADFVDDAIEEILQQLDVKNKLLKNSVGILSCNYEFVATGTALAICEALPFSVVGCTTQGYAIKGAQGHFMLLLSVLTSDDVFFSTAVSKPLTQNPEPLIVDTYHQALRDLNQTPSMIMTFQPYIPQLLSGDLLIQSLDSVTGGIPVFGSVALDFTTNFRTPLTIYNNKSYEHCLPLLLLSGNVTPTFFMESISEDYFLCQNAKITDSCGNRLISINHTPAIQFLEEIGLMINDSFDGTQIALPVSVDYHDGTKPKTCLLQAISSDGSIICGGEMPKGATLAIGTLLHDDVIKTTKKLLLTLQTIPDKNALFLFSCFGRNTVLSDPMAEINLIQKSLNNYPAPYVYFSSGGEICPSYLAGGVQTINRFHNNSIIACLL